MPLEHVKSSKLAQEATAGGAFKVNTRKCTDAPCCVVFIACIVGMAYVNNFATANGDLRKLTNGFDWKDDLCGIANATRHESFLFWCKPAVGTTQWRLEDGICVKACPTSNDTFSMCPGKPHIFYNHTPKDEVPQIVIKGVRRKLVQQHDYATVATGKYAGYCIPKMNKANKFLYQSFMDQSATKDAVQQIMTAFNAIVAHQEILWFAAVLGLVLGYAFMFFIKICAIPLLVIMLIVAEVGVLACGGYLVYAPMCAATYNNSTGIDVTICPFDLYPSGSFYRENSTYIMVSGVVVFACWLVASVLLCCKRDSIKATMAAIGNGALLVAKMPTLMLQPLLQTIIKMPTLIALIWGLAWVVSLGEPAPITLDDPATGSSVKGLNRTFKFTQSEWYMVIFWSYMTVWILEFVSAMGQFAISQAVIMHEVNGVHSWFPLAHGYLNALLFHSGTIAFGAFILGTLRIINAIFQFLARQAKKGDDEDGNPQYNVAVKMVCCCCLCCMQCIVQMMELVNDLVYCECALDGKGYMGSAAKVLKCVGAHAVEYAVVEYAMGFLKGLGLLSITFCGTWLTYEYLNLFVDPLPQPAGIAGITIAAALISLFIAMAFMHTFCQAALTAVYISYWEEGNPEQPAQVAVEADSDYVQLK